MSFDAVVGHERPIRVLRRTLRSGRVPHAYLFWGPDGVGKERVARAAARVLLCAAPEGLERAEGCGRCAGCRKAAAGSHPDLHLLAPSGNTVPVADVRALQERLAFQAFERGRKVAIIRDAFRMTREAANGLLKTLEEPPAGTHIFLLAHHRNQLLPTLVSRCQCLRFDPVAEEQVRRLLEERGVEPGAARSLAAAAGGCPGAVLGRDPEALGRLEAEVADLRARWPRMGVGDRFAASSRWAAEKDRLSERLEALERALRRELREGGSGAALDLLEALYRTRGLIDRNVNVQLALDALFLGVGQPGWEECR
ncbi:MAG: DNA polymerase III subunit delta' [Deferrisomatales bacterium]